MQSNNKIKKILPNNIGSPIIRTPTYSEAIQQGLAASGYVPEIDNTPGANNPLSYAANGYGAGSAQNPNSAANGVSYAQGMSDYLGSFGNPEKASAAPNVNYGNAPSGEEMPSSVMGQSGGNSNGAVSTQPTTGIDVPSYADFYGQKAKAPSGLEDVYSDEILYQDFINSQKLGEIGSAGNVQKLGGAPSGASSGGYTRFSAEVGGEGATEPKYSDIDEIIRGELGLTEEEYDELLAAINSGSLEYAPERARHNMMKLSAEQKERVIAAASARKEREIADANAAKERAMVDANSSYQQNKSDAAANSAALADMGLQGSGYSDYLDAQAYAAYRDEIQAARAASDKAISDAYANEEASKLEADLLYSENIAGAFADYEEAKATQRSAEISNYEKKIASGLMTAEEVDEVISEKGYSEKEAQILRDALAAYEKDAKEMEIRDYINNIGYGLMTADEVEKVIAEKGYSDKEAKRLRDAYAIYYKNKIEDVSREYYLELVGYIQEGYTITDEYIDSLVEAKQLTPEDAERLKKDQINAMLRLTGNYEADIKTINDLIKNNKIDKPTYQSKLAEIFRTYIDNNRASLTGPVKDQIINNIQIANTNGGLSGDDALDLITYLLGDSILDIKE